MRHEEHRLPRLQTHGNRSMDMNNLQYPGCMAIKPINKLDLESLPAPNEMTIEALEEVLVTLLPELEERRWMRDIRADEIPQFVVSIREAPRDIALIEVRVKQNTTTTAIRRAPIDLGPRTGQVFSISSDNAADVV